MLVARFVRGVTDHFLLRLPEWGLAFILLSYGTTLLEPGSTFTNPIFAVMRKLADEDTWGWSLTGVALARLFALAMNGTFCWFRRFSPYVRAGAAFLSCFVWFALAVGYYMASTMSPSARTYGCLMIVDLILAVYVAGEAGHTERRHRNGC